MIYVKCPGLPRQCLSICLLGLLLIELTFAQSPERHICKDSHTDNYFSFIPPEGWLAANLETFSGPSKNTIYRLSQWLNALPQGGTTVAVCYQTGTSYTQQPLVLIYRAYNMNGTGTELEARWLSEKYQRRKQKELYARESLVTNNDYIKHRFPPVSVDDIQILHACYEYRQDIHAAFENIEGTIHGKGFTRIRATILGGLNHAAVFCHFEGPDRNKAKDLVNQIVNTFEFESDNVFGGVLDQQGLENRDFGLTLMPIAILAVLCTPIAIGSTLGIWLSARDCGLEFQFYKAVIIGFVSTLTFALPPYKLFISFGLYLLATYGLLALFIRDNYYDDLVKVTGCAAVGAFFGAIALWIYIVFRLTVF